MSSPKEPHFFNRDGLFRIDTVIEYEALFAQANPGHIAVGEASTEYVNSHDAVPRILEYNPDARFIVCIRNPVDMAPSLHAERIWRGEERARRFEDAWRLQDLRSTGMAIPKTIRKNPERLQYGAYCRLGEQLGRLFSHVPKERVLVIVLDDMAANPVVEYQRVLSFLGVPNDGRDEFPVLNQRKAVRFVLLSYITRCWGEMKRAVGIKRRLGIGSRLRNLNRQRPQGIPELSSMRAELISYFQEDVRLLEGLLHRDLSRWLE